MSQNSPPLSQDSTLHDAIEILNSPVQFVVIGPKGNGQAVLIRSECASLSLIGWRFEESTDSFDDPLAWFYRLLGPRYYGRCSVLRTKPLPVDLLVQDDRSSTFTFVWNGYPSFTDHRSLDDEFNRRAPDLQAAIAKVDREKVEWILAPLIAHCSEFDRRQNFLRDSARIFVGSFLLFVFWNAFRAASMLLRF